MEIKEATKVLREISQETDFEELIPGRIGTSEEYPRYSGDKLEALKFFIELGV